MLKIQYICNMRIFLFISFFVIYNSTFAQLVGATNRPLNDSIIPIKPKTGNDSLNLKIYKPTINDYQFWTENSKRTVIDTTLSLRNEYRYTQSNNRDNFAQIAFNNLGQPYNTLLYRINKTPTLILLPKGKEQIYTPVEEIRYFDVKTPTTEFIYHNGFKEGQGLSTLFTHNLNSQLNYAIEYKGIRSLGHYLESEVDSRNFIVSTNFHTKNRKYKVWSHYSYLNSGAVENAGIKTKENFTSGNGNYKNRQRLQVNLNGARSKYLNRRYFLGQSFNFIKNAKDSLKDEKRVLLKNTFNFESIDYRYFEKNENQFYLDISEYIPDAKLEINKFNKVLNNTTTLAFELKNKLEIEAGVKYQNIDYFFDNDTIITLQNFPRELEDNRFGLVGNLRANFSSQIYWTAEAQVMAGDVFQSNYNFNTHIDWNLNDQFRLYGSFSSQSKIPDLNLIYNQSFYDNFNFYLKDYKNELINEFLGGIELKKYQTWVQLRTSNIENYTYLSYEGKALQSAENLPILQLEARNQLQFKKFHLDSWLAFQNIPSNQNVLPLPSFIGRFNLYYKSMMFRDAAHVQIGLKTKFFTQFESREFFPIVNDFKLQNPAVEKVKIGNYPIMDFYLDMRVKSMQIYLEAQHFNSGFTGYNYFSTPNIPLYDFRLNIGLVWYLFT